MHVIYAAMSDNDMGQLCMYGLYGLGYMRVMLRDKLNKLNGHIARASMLHDDRCKCDVHYAMYRYDLRAHAVNDVDEGQLCQLCQDMTIGATMTVYMY